MNILNQTDFQVGPGKDREVWVSEADQIWDSHILVPKNEPFM